MAKLTVLPSLAIIDGFKGTIDFYVWMGIPCARKWPRSPGHDRAPGVEAQWTAWRWATTNWQSLSQFVRDAYNHQAQGTNLTGRDIFTKGFISAKGLILEDV